MEGKLDFPDVIRFNRGSYYSLKFSGRLRSGKDKSTMDDHSVYSLYLGYGKNDFYHVNIKNTAGLTETFRRQVIKLFVDKKLLNKDFAKQLLTWRNSGFSVDNSVFLFPYADQARESLCQYIVRHPVSLQKITYEPDKKKVIYHTKYNEYWGENIKLFSACDFIAQAYPAYSSKR